MSTSRSLTVSWPAAPAQFISFDGSTRIAGRSFAPDRYRFWDQRGAVHAGISRGAGLSYPAASFSASIPSIDHSRFDRLLDFDSDNNILEVEAGATLGQIYDFATRRGLFLAVQPGHPKITVGGCIGADVHGKNQFRDGTFLAQVEGLRLFHASHGILDLSRSREPELFRLTCGGYGLTGNILSARLRLGSIPSPNVTVNVLPVIDIFRLTDDLASAAAQQDLVYSWHDFTARGDRFGRGFLVTGSFAAGMAGGEVARHRGTAGPRSLNASRRGCLPIRFFNRLTTPVFNRLYWALTRLSAPNKLLSFYEFLFPVHNKEIYFYLFGNTGFHEYQLLLETARFPEFIAAVKTRLQRRPVAVTLASAKLFRGTRELLRFTGDGICLALDFPRNQAGWEFAAFLDDLMRECGGWPNLIKDSRLTPPVVAAAYPDYGGFRQQLRRFDPRRLYVSELSARLGL